MKSPDLDPELSESLLSALSEWDQSQTIAFSHDFMRLGDESALAAYDALGLSNPVVQQLLADRYLSPAPDLEFLASLPEGTLGHAFQEYFTGKGLDTNMLRESAFIDAHKRRGEDVGYVAERGWQLHDIFHVLTGWDTSPLGEIKVVSFTVAQTPAPYPALTMAMRPLQAALYKPDLFPVLLDAITEGWSLGRRTSCLIGVHWEDFWDCPLDELRAKYGLL